MKVEKFKRFSLKMLCCKARAFPVGMAYGYMISRPFFTPRKTRMRINLKRCLGFWWRRDLFATRAVEEGISKARRVVFQFGSVGTFQGVLNVASSKPVIETCIMPVLLKECENWILKEQLINQLNSFLGELAKRCLRWPKHHSNTAAQVAPDLESIRSRLLLTKLGFLRRSMLNDAGLGLVQR